MPFAAEGRVQHDPIEGGVEISDAEYAAAIEGMMAGKIVTVSGGFAIVDRTEPEEPEVTTSQKIISAPANLFGGPSLGEIFNGNR